MARQLGDRLVGEGVPAAHGDDAVRGHAARSSSTATAWACAADSSPMGERPPICS